MMQTSQMSILIIIAILFLFTLAYVPHLSRWIANHTKWHLIKVFMVSWVIVFTTYALGLSVMILLFNGYGLEDIYVSAFFAIPFAFMMMTVVYIERRKQISI